MEAEADGKNMKNEVAQPGPSGMTDEPALAATCNLEADLQLRGNLACVTAFWQVVPHACFPMTVPMSHFVSL